MSKFRIGLIPMSAKPYHRGHHSLVEIASNENDLVIVFVSYSSRGTKKATKSNGGKERTIPGEVPVFGSDMKYIWENLLIPNLCLPSNVIIRSPSHEVPNSPVSAVYDVVSEIHKSHEEKKQTLLVPHSGVIVCLENVLVKIYSDDIDIDKNYPSELMNEKYPATFGTLVQKSGIKRESTVNISGTDMRKFLHNGNKESFLSMLPDLPEAVLEEIFYVLSNSAINSCPRNEWVLFS
jgi:hypothetical protein